MSGKIICICWFKHLEWFSPTASLIWIYRLITHGSPDPHQPNLFSQSTHCMCIYAQKTTCRCTHLDEPNRYERHVVGTEHGANQHLLHPPVEVHLQVLHFFADEVRRETAGVGGHGLNTVQLTGVLLPCFLQDGEIFPCPTAQSSTAHLFRTHAAQRGHGSSPPEVTAKSEERDIHSKPEGER